MDQQPGDDNYIELAINTHTLRRLLQAQQLHVDECFCTAPDSKRTLTNLLLSSILTDAQG